MADATQAELDALQTAIRSGHLTVTYSTPGGGTRTITYRSLADMERIESKMLAELGQRTATFADRGVSVSTNRDLE